MDNEQSVTQWVQKVIQGEEGLVQAQLVERFLCRLTALARSKMRDVRGFEDEQDVALSAMKSFLVRAPRDEFHQVSDRNALWSLLAAITIKKAITARRRMLAKKRDIRRSQSLDEVLTSGPDHAFLDSVFDEGNRLLSELEDETLREIAKLRLEGYTNEEIAESIGRSVKTVERKFLLLRKRLAAELNREDD
jgi:DNA-directed RNA polymerase specialized sigma24 family protein